MLRNERARYEMFVRVTNFGNEHKSQFPATSAAGKAFAAVAEAAATIERGSTQKAVSSQTGRKARAEARRDVWGLLTDIARTAREAGRTELASDSFDRPRRRGDAALVAAARDVIAKGETAAAEWVRLGMPESTLADLKRAVARLQAAVDARQEAMRTSREAGVNIRRAVGQGFDAVRQLDAIVANAFKNDDAMLAAWRGDRRLKRSTAAKHHVVPAPTPQPTPVPVPTPAPTPDPAPVVPPAPPVDGPVTPEATSTTGDGAPDDGLRKAS